MNTLFAGGGFKSASALLRSEKPIGSRMFYFEDEPHDDGTFVHEAVQSMVGEIVDVAMPSPFKARAMGDRALADNTGVSRIFHRPPGERPQARPRRERPLCRYLERRMHLRPDLNRSSPNRGIPQQGAAARESRKTCELHRRPYRLAFRERNRHVRYQQRFPDRLPDATSRVAYDRKRHATPVVHPGVQHLGSKQADRRVGMNAATSSTAPFSASVPKPCRAISRRAKKSQSQASSVTRHGTRTDSAIPNSI